MYNDHIVSMLYVYVYMHAHGCLVTWYACVYRPQLLPRIGLHCQVVAAHTALTSDVEAKYPLVVLLSATRIRLRVRVIV